MQTGERGRSLRKHDSTFIMALFGCCTNDAAHRCRSNPISMICSLPFSSRRCNSMASAATSSVAGRYVRLQCPGRSRAGLHHPVTGRRQDITDVGDGRMVQADRAPVCSCQVKTFLICAADKIIPLPPLPGQQSREPCFDRCQQGRCNQACIRETADFCFRSKANWSVRVAFQPLISLSVWSPMNQQQAESPFCTRQWP